MLPTRVPRPSARAWSAAALCRLLLRYPPSRGRSAVKGTPRQLARRIFDEQLLSRLSARAERRALPACLDRPPGLGVRQPSAAFCRDARQIEKGPLSKTRLCSTHVTFSMRNSQAGYRLARSDEPPACPDRPRGLGVRQPSAAFCCDTRQVEEGPLLKARPGSTRVPFSMRNC